MYDPILRGRSTRLMINHSDSNLCGVGSDVLCYIEPSAQGDSPPGAIANLIDQMDTRGDGDFMDSLGPTEIRGGDSISNSDWLSSDSSGLIADSLNSNGLQNSWETMPTSEGLITDLADTSPDSSLLSR